MAVNLSVIAVDVGDTVELMGSSEGNYIVPSEIESMAERIIEVCRHGSRTNSRELVTRLSMERIAEQVVGVYAIALRGQYRHQGRSAATPDRPNGGDN